jgi:hypothetical protein
VVLFIIETQSIAPTMSGPAQEALAAMFAGLAPHFRALAHGRVAVLGDDLLRKIDIGIDKAALEALRKRPRLVGEASNGAPEARRAVRHFPASQAESGSGMSVSNLRCCMANSGAREDKQGSLGKSRERKWS